MLWLIILFALALGALCSASESAFTSASRLRIEVEARRGDGIGPLVRRLVEEPSRYLTTTLAGLTAAAVVCATLLALALDQPLLQFFGSTLRLGNAAAIPATVIVQILVATIVLVVFGVILPKSIMRENATQAVFALVQPLRVLRYALLPLIKTAEWSSALIGRLFGAESESLQQLMRKQQEVQMRAIRTDGETTPDDGETALVSNVLALSGLRVKESMVPRTDIEAIEEDASIDELRRQMVETGLSKLPVYRDNIDHITGVVFAYDLFQQPATMAEIVKPVKFVPESKRSKDLLREFLATNASIAIVIDEYGGTAGLVTREDLLEELFGDIQDEFDVEEFVMRQTSENSFTVSGRVEVDELTERYGLNFPEGDYETIAGYLLERLGTIPAVRQEFLLDGYRFVILKATSNRIDLLRIIRRPAASPNAPRRRGDAQA